LLLLLSLLLLLLWLLLLLSLLLLLLMLRRQLFQTVSSDTRLTFLKKTASSKDKPELARPEWRQFLDKVCEKAAVMHCVDGLVAAATEMGVGLETEVVQFARGLAKAAGLKRLETVRFFKAVASVAPLPSGLAPSTSQARDGGDDGDPFGHNAGGIDCE